MFRYKTVHSWHDVCKLLRSVYFKKTGCFVQLVLYFVRGDDLDEGIHILILSFSHGNTVPRVRLEKFESLPIRSSMFKSVIMFTLLYLLHGQIDARVAELVSRTFKTYT